MARFRAPRPFRSPNRLRLAWVLGLCALAPNPVQAKRSQLTPDWYRSFFNYRSLANDWLTPDIDAGRKQPDSVTAMACDELSSLSCAAGTYDDGTGAATTPTLEASRARRQAEEIRERTRGSDVDSAWEDLLNGENRELFRKIKDAFRLAGGDGCGGSLDRLTTLCKQSMAPKLSELTWRMIDAHDAAYVDKRVDAPLASPIEGEPAYAEFAPLIQDPAFQSAQARFVAALREHAIPDQKTLLDQIEDRIFPEVRRLVIERLKESVKNPDLAAHMATRLASVKFDRDLNCAERDPFAGVLDPGARYRRDTHTVQLCGKMLWMNRSEFGIVFQLARELAHAVDPCGLSLPVRDDWKTTDLTRIPNPGRTLLASEKNYPLGRPLLECLRGDKSVHALPPLHPAVNIDPMGRGRAVFCGELSGDPAGTLDQITEAVPDWIAAEVLPLYMQNRHPELIELPAKMRLGYANAFRGLCRADFAPPIVPGDVHPPIARRIESILAVHPLVRTQMGCPPVHPRYSYCAGPVSRNFKGY